jgi:predicted GNAT family acetyltransferase
MTNVVIREARREDAPAIIGFQLEMAQETEGLSLDRDTLTRGVAAIFDDPALGRYFVAEADGRVVASLMVTHEWSDWRNGMVWWIQSVYTMPEYRRRGIYAALYTNIKARVEIDPRIRGLRLYVDTTNTAAQQVYTRLEMVGDHYKVFEWMK